MSVTGWLLEVAYKLNRYRWGEFPLTVVAVALLLLAAGAVQFGWLGGGFWLLSILVLLALALAALALVGRVTGYARFVPSAGPGPSVAPEPLSPMDKIPHRATGRFGVEGKRRHLVEVRAWFRTFQTREHAVMAYVQPSRLFPGKWPAHEVGMWYIFFRSKQIRRVEIGQVQFGARPRPGIRVTYQSDEHTETVLLSFDSAEERQRVYADLLEDAPGAANDA